MEFIFIRLPVIDPVIKLIPIMKLIGSVTVSPIIRLTLLLVELFCIPIIRTRNKEKLNVNINNSFFKRNSILKLH